MATQKQSSRNTLIALGLALIIVAVTIVVSVMYTSNKSEHVGVDVTKATTEPACSANFTIPGAACNQICTKDSDCQTGFCDLNVSICDIPGIFCRQPNNKPTASVCRSRQNPTDFTCGTPIPTPPASPRCSALGACPAGYGTTCLGQLPTYCITPTPGNTVVPTSVPTTALTPTATSMTTPTNTPTANPTEVPTVAPTGTGTITPTATPASTFIANPPSWWYVIPDSLRNYLEELYVYVFFFGRTTSNMQLLNGIPTPSPIPTATPTP